MNGGHPVQYQHRSSRGIILCTGIISFESQPVRQSACRVVFIKGGGRWWGCGADGSFIHSFVYPLRGDTMFRWGEWEFVAEWTVLEVSAPPVTNIGYLVFNYELQYFFFFLFPFIVAVFFCPFLDFCCDLISFGCSSCLNKFQEISLRAHQQIQLLSSSSSSSAGM